MIKKDTSVTGQGGMTNQDLMAVLLPNGSLQLEWAAAAETIHRSRELLQREIYKRFVRDAGACLLFLGFSDSSVPLSESLDFWRGFARLFTERLSRTPDLEILRERVELQLTPDDIDHFLDHAPPMTGLDYLNAPVLGAVWAGLGEEFGKAIKSHDGAVADFIRTYSPSVHLVGRVFFHLVENRDGDHPFAFLATYSTRLNQEGKSTHLPLKYALREFEGREKELLDLLSTVYRAAEDSIVIADLLESGDLFHPLSWSARKAFLFLKDTPVFEDAGILCRIPNWWKGRGAGVRLGLQFGDKKPSLLGMDAILNFNAHLVLEGTPLSVKEAEKLLAQSEGLAFIKNKWVAIDPDKLKKTLEAYEKAKTMMTGEGISLQDALRLQLNPKKLLDIAESDVDIGVSHGKWLAGVIEKLRDPGKIAPVRPGKRFLADLRQYQKTGLNWLNFLHSLGFGACLADDMGLGKTVQVLAFLDRLKSEPKKKKKSTPASLLIIPASLISNWTHEIERFCPDLDFLVAHPGANVANDMPAKYKDRLDDYDLVITTYALANRYAWLRSHRWYYVILDEAQAVKNPGAKQTRAIKKYIAQNRIIMTGTPIENRLSDLWSLFDFLNPGLLGNATEFKKFSKKLSRDRSGYSRLRRLIRPYVLRRLKTDKSIISDLPEKVEMKTYATLSAKQTVLYQQLVDRIKVSLSEKDGIQRKGVILSSLMKFKQLCNHPDQYLGTGGYLETESGKFLRLREICETIYAKREKLLVFTQFKEITGPLSEYLASIFERSGLTIHGSVPVGKRKKIIDEFQGGNYVPFMVLSLKAGGVGLNLTEANHVIHFDRWWNPAVENQATDRAFRIGQKKNVVVHKFVTRGTVEEKIDGMLMEKTRLSNDVIADTGEAWITELNNEQILDLFSISL
jgi:superfamily II DNA or RNA helicase